ncbi:MAG TPA: G1 family glutamic endopeptidase [Acidimicrobiales bacterium]|nr:G1 family glutamic endopeptidase [Acidimicrobiales bacterium]
MGDVVRSGFGGRCRRGGPCPRRPRAWLRGITAAIAAGAGLLGALAGSAAAEAAPSQATASTVVHAPRIPINGFGVQATWSSTNWSGYAKVGTFAGVNSTWTVPAVAASASPTFSSAWIGVDGYANSSLIQTGTEQDYYNGAAHYAAWWEILPAPETALPTSDPVIPGDRMKASIYETSTVSGPVHGHRVAHLWVVTISDTSRGWSYSTRQSYSGPGASAEWIVEAPQVNGAVSTLAHYTVTPPAGTGDFDNAGDLTSPVASGSPAYVNAGLNYLKDAGVMAQNGVQVSTPSDPDGALTAFNAAYGSALPAAPTG